MKIIDLLKKLIKIINKDIKIKNNWCWKGEKLKEDYLTKMSKTAVGTYILQKIQK